MLFVSYNLVLKGLITDHLQVSLLIISDMAWCCSCQEHFSEILCISNAIVVGRDIFDICKRLTGHNKLSCIYGPFFGKLLMFPRRVIRYYRGTFSSWYRKLRLHYFEMHCRSCDEKVKLKTSLANLDALLLNLVVVLSEERTKDGLSVSTRSLDVGDAEC